MSDKDVREAVARSICGKNCDMPKCSFQPGADNQAMCRLMSLEDADAAITAYEAALKDQGLVIVKRTDALIAALAEGDPWEDAELMERVDQDNAAMLSASQPTKEK